MPWFLMGSCDRAVIVLVSKTSGLWASRVRIPSAAPNILCARAHFYRFCGVGWVWVGGFCLVWLMGRYFGFFWFLPPKKWIDCNTRTLIYPSFTSQCTRAVFHKSFLPKIYKLWMVFVGFVMLFVVFYKGGFFQTPNKYLLNPPDPFPLWIFPVPAPIFLRG